MNYDEFISLIPKPNSSYNYYKLIIEPFYNEDLTTQTKKQFAELFLKHRFSFNAQYSALQQLLAPLLKIADDLELLSRQFTSPERKRQLRDLEIRTRRIATDV